MNVAEDLPGLAIDSPLAVPSALNFRPPTWPPPDDFPVVIDARGEVVSRFGDESWEFWPWEGKACSVNFVRSKSGYQVVTACNASFFRQIAGWWLWGPDSVQKASTFQACARMIKPLFVVCSEAGVGADELSRFPALIEQVARRLPPSTGYQALARLNALWVARETLGFFLLDESGLRELANHLPDYDGHEQTAYIPPRIWTYQVSRLDQCVDDYLNHRDQIEACYRFCLGAYAHNAGGSLAAAFGMKGNIGNPFAYGPNQAVHRGRRSGRKYYGAFRNTADRFGIAGLFDRWLQVDEQMTVVDLSSYLTLVSVAGLAYCLNFSLMRADECAQLRSDCLTSEVDELGYEIHLLGGVTTKTVQDGDARWVVSPAVAKAMDALVQIARLRVDCSMQNPALRLNEADISNPLLLARATEPWSSVRGDADKRLRLRPYSDIVSRFPKLFDLEQLRMTASDGAIASQMTTGLNPERFGVGLVWPMAWHQLRRTGAVNMLASGLVSEASLQYQLKHASRGMTRYYGQNWYKLKVRLDTDATGLFLKEKFRILAREFAALKADEIVSPHGDKRKAQILNIVAEKDHEGLVAAAQAGRINYHRTMFGGCTNPGGPCAYGGVANFAFCMGFGSQKPCEHAMLDTSQENSDRIKRLQRSVRIRLLDAQHGSALWKSLNASLDATQRYLDAADAV